MATVQRKTIALTQNEPEQFAHPANVLQRIPPTALRTADVLALQRTVGNRVVQRMLRSRIDEDRPFMAHSLSRRETGLPDNLKAGIESLSGLSLDDVKVHYNSSEPAKLQARAFTQGTDIFLGPNEEEHLPHEAWHVVQQRQGRVRPTMQLKATGLPANDDAALEREADEMGARTLSQPPPSRDALKISPTAHAASITAVVQRVKWVFGMTGWYTLDDPEKEAAPSGDINKVAMIGDTFDKKEGFKSAAGNQILIRIVRGGGGGGGGGGADTFFRVENAPAPPAAIAAGVAAPAKGTAGSGSAAAVAAAAPEKAVAGEVEARPPRPNEVVFDTPHLQSDLYLRSAGPWRKLVLAKGKGKGKGKGELGQMHAEKKLWLEQKPILKKRWASGAVGRSWVGFVQNAAPCQDCVEFFTNESNDGGVKKFVAGFVFQVMQGHDAYRGEPAYNDIKESITTPDPKTGKMKSFGLYFVDGKMTPDLN